MQRQEHFQVPSVSCISVFQMFLYLYFCISVFLFFCISIFPAVNIVAVWQLYMCADTETGAPWEATDVCETLRTFIFFSTHCADWYFLKCLKIFPHIDQNKILNCHNIYFLLLTLLGPIFWIYQTVTMFIFFSSECLQIKKKIEYLKLSYIDFRSHTLLAPIF